MIFKSTLHLPSSFCSLWYEFIFSVMTSPFFFFHEFMPMKMSPFCKFKAFGIISPEIKEKQTYKSMTACLSLGSTLIKNNKNKK